MKVGIIGLGLVGGSLAKAYQSSETAEIYGYDNDASVREFARISGAVNGILTKELLPCCDLILFAIPPKAIVSFIRRYAPLFGKNPLLIDCAGVKRAVCDSIFPLAEKYGFTFIGGHPMAGSGHSGFRNSRSDLFHGAPMILVPPRYDDTALLDRAEKLLAPAGFGSYSVCTAEEHDRLIAYSSQLSHLLSNAYAQCPGAVGHSGFSAESYEDMSRAASMNPDMWTELLLTNADYLKTQLDDLIGILGSFRQALAKGDAEKLHTLLENGRNCKEETNGE